MTTKDFFFQKRGYKYVIHDLLHDLAQNLSNGEILIVDDRKVEIPERVRHISINASNLLLLCNNKYAKKNLRSLVISNWFGESLDMLKELKGLRMLLIPHGYKGYKGELSSESIHRMFHLRYLEIEYYLLRGFHKLPKSLGKLYHLQVLNVDNWWSNDSYCVLPEETNKLINLHHLEAYTAEIVGIGRLILLKKLSFHVKQRESGFEIGQLGEMSQLRKLNIEGLESVESKEQASEAMLENKEHLSDLKLKWKRHNNNDDSEVLEGLRPHQNLKRIRIHGYAGRRSPSWWNGNWLSRLQSIKLYGCSKWKEILSSLGQLCFLKEVYLVRMNAVRRIVTLSSSLSSLVHLHVSKMSELVELSEVEEEGLQLFPRLSILTVYKCPKLKGSRLLFTPSQFKHILISSYEVDGVVRFECETDEKINILFSESKISMVDEWIPWNNLTSTEHLHIEFYILRSIPREWFQHLNSLRTLYLTDCYSLEFLPSNLISSLSSLQALLIYQGLSLKSLPEEGLPTSLQTLLLYECDEIKSLPEVGLPAALQRLDINRCRYLSERCKKDGPDWHKISHIPYINIDRKVVQNLRNDDGYDHFSHLSFTSHYHSDDDDYDNNEDADDE